MTAGAICGTQDFLAGLMSLNDGSLMLLGPTMDPRQVCKLHGTQATALLACRDQ